MLALPDLMLQNRQNYFQTKERKGSYSTVFAKTWLILGLAPFQVLSWSKRSLIAIIDYTHDQVTFYRVFETFIYP